MVAAGGLMANAQLARRKDLAIDKVPVT